MNRELKRIIDICMCVVLLLLMAYQVTGELLHEWIGVIMTILVIIHQILNIKWYESLFKGKYNSYRFISMIINVLLILSFILTALCGLSMSGYALPFLYGMFQTSFSRIMHLSLSHYSFILMGLHLGLHIPSILSVYKLSEKTRKIISIASCLIAGIGLYLFIKNGMFEYILFKEVFAFLDYDKPAILILLENIVMLLFWVFVASQLTLLSRNKNNHRPIIMILISIIIGLTLNSFVTVNENITNNIEPEVNNTIDENIEGNNMNNIDIKDTFILIDVKMF